MEENQLTSLQKSTIENRSSVELSSIKKHSTSTSRTSEIVEANSLSENMMNLIRWPVKKGGRKAADVSGQFEVLGVHLDLTQMWSSLVRSACACGRRGHSKEPIGSTDRLQERMAVVTPRVMRR